MVINSPYCSNEELASPKANDSWHFLNAVSSKLMLFGLTIDVTHLMLLDTPSHNTNPNFNFSLIIIIPTIITFADTHNMIVFLMMSDVSEGFDQIVDFLNAHMIQYALMVNPIIYVSCIKQFWTSVSINNSNDVVRLKALIDRKKVIITKDSIRQALRLDDADGIDCLPNE
nr:hypothetical protein [Tanacetum cinerariifolium]